LQQKQPKMEKKIHLVIMLNQMGEVRLRILQDVFVDYWLIINKVIDS